MAQEQGVTGPDAAPATNQGGGAGRKIWRERVLPILLYLRRNPPLILGIALLFGLLLFIVVGQIVHGAEGYRPLSGPPMQSPSADYPFGTDRTGRDILAVMIAGTPLTLRIGLIAGALGLGLGTVLAFVAAYYGGLIDGVIRTVVDVGLTIPGLLILILIAVNVGSSLSVNTMGLAVAAVAWVQPARTIRAQVLLLREQPYVEIARLSGTSGMGIIFKEMMPNLMPFLLASFVGAISSAILASIGLEALGLGPFDSPTIGMTVYWNIRSTSILLGMWWWFTPPIVALIVVFVGLFLVATGLDEWSNPRLRKRV